MATHTVPISELRAHLAAAIAQVEAGERLLLTRHDRVVAALVPPQAGAPSAIEERAAELLVALTPAAADADADAAAENLPDVLDVPTLDVTSWVTEIRQARRA